MCPRGGGRVRASFAPLSRSVARYARSYDAPFGRIVAVALLANRSQSLLNHPLPLVAPRTGAR